MPAGGFHGEAKTVAPSSTARLAVASSLPQADWVSLTGILSTEKPSCPSPVLNAVVRWAAVRSPIQAACTMAPKPLIVCFGAAGLMLAAAADASVGAMTDAATASTGTAPIVVRTVRRLSSRRSLPTGPSCSGVMSRPSDCRCLSMTVRLRGQGTFRSFDVGPGAAGSLRRRTAEAGSARRAGRQESEGGGRAGRERTVPGRVDHGRAGLVGAQGAVPGLADRLAGGQCPVSRPAVDRRRARGDRHLALEAPGPRAGRAIGGGASAGRRRAGGRRAGGRCRRRG